ncbi:MAG: DUF4105 domain-containing protein [Chitinophagaceae bacterium]|nr:DUF4105 domain-containing protein [Chitinophagaceae bacterium]
MLKLRTVIIFLLFTFYFLLFNKVSAQDSSHLRISLLTCTPGNELYSTFGHSAYRVIDSSKAFNDNWRDVVYNYGTFNFDDDGFYLKFVQGKLLYYVSVVIFPDFKFDYQTTNRGITEQVLHLTAEEKISIQQFLNNNIKEENKYYKYDFFFDNCTTRLRDILKKQNDSSFTKVAVMPPGSRFRQAIHQYLDKNHKDWSKLGIDILLGQPCDGVMTTENMQFLPDNLMKSLDSSDHKMILSSENLYPITDENARGSIFTPFVVFSILFIGIVLLGFVKNKFVQVFLQGFDGLFFFLTGLLGIILIFMWLGTDHSMTKNNFNLLWAWPTHSIMAFFVNSKKQWVQKYFKLTAVALMAVLISWFFLPQQMNNGLLPIVLLLIYRSVKKSWSDAPV